LEGNTPINLTFDLELDLEYDFELSLDLSLELANGFPDILAVIGNAFVPWKFAALPLELILNDFLKSISVNFF
jgi:hypothetical protein